MRRAAAGGGGRQLGAPGISRARWRIEINGGLAAVRVGTAWPCRLSGGGTAAACGAPRQLKMNSLRLHGASASGGAASSWRSDGARQPSMWRAPPSCFAHSGAGGTVYSVEPTLHMAPTGASVYSHKLLAALVCSLSSAQSSFRCCRRETHRIVENTRREWTDTAFGFVRAHEDRTCRNPCRLPKHCTILCYSATTIGCRASSANGNAF